MIPRASLRVSAASAAAAYAKTPAAVTMLLSDASADAFVLHGDAIEMPRRACKPAFDACNLPCNVCNLLRHACNSPCNASTAKSIAAATLADAFSFRAGSSAVRTIAAAALADVFSLHAGSSAVWTIAAAALTDAVGAMFVDAVTPAASPVMRRVAVAAYPGRAAAVVSSAVAIADFCIYWCFGGGNRGGVRSAAISTLIKPIDAATDAIFAAAE